jgi:hypothetical protein
MADLTKEHCSICGSPDHTHLHCYGTPAQRTSNLVVHQLKCWPEYFGPILDGRKTFEVRKNDRGFKSGHVLHLREWRPQIEGGYYTGRETHVRVLGVYSDLPGVREGHVVMSLGNGVRVTDETSDAR